MTFNVRLIVHVNTIFITEFIETAVLRIIANAPVKKMKIEYV